MPKDNEAQPPVDVSEGTCEHGYSLNISPMPPCDCRPVTCAVCKRQMFYDNDVRHEPESTFSKSGTLNGIFIHDRCIGLGVTDTAVDEVQRRIDAVVEAAVEWKEGADSTEEIFAASDRLEAAIDSLLELRDKPTTPSVAAGRHVDFRFDNKDGCKVCGLVRPHDGWKKPCKGPFTFSLRETAVGGEDGLVNHLLQRHPHVGRTEGILGGKLIVGGIRIAVTNILAYLYNGNSIEHISKTYGLSPEQVKCAIAFAQDFIEESDDRGAATAPQSTVVRQGSEEAGSLTCAQCKRQRLNSTMVVGNFVCRYCLSLEHEPAPPVVSTPDSEAVCIKCPHNNVDRHGECRQCVDWQRHKCEFTAATPPHREDEAVARRVISQWITGSRPNVLDIIGLNGPALIGHIAAALAAEREACATSAFREIHNCRAGSTCRCNGRRDSQKETARFNLTVTNSHGKLLTHESSTI